MLRSSRLALCIGLLAASLAASAHATLQTVGVYDSTNNANAVDVVAAGSSLTLAEATNAIAAAFANNTGGVWNFDTAVAGEWDSTLRNSFALSYGVSQANTLILGSSVTAFLNDSSANPISGTGAAVDWQGTVNFTINTQLTLVAFTQLSNSSGRTAQLQVTLQDNTVLETTAQISNGAPGTDYFHVLTATPANPIVSFKIIGNSFLRVDDLAFVAIPEPTSLTLVGLGLLGAWMLRRHRPAAVR